MKSDVKTMRETQKQNKMSVMQKKFPKKKNGKANRNFFKICNNPKKWKKLIESLIK